MRAMKRLGLLAVVLAGGTAAQAARTAISCTGETVQEYKSFNLPPKTVQETRIYVIDDSAKTIALFNADHELEPLCDKAQPACHADFLPAGIRIDFQGDGQSLKMIYDRAAQTFGAQADNPALTTTFQGKCMPVDPAAK